MYICGRTEEHICIFCTTFFIDMISSYANSSLNWMFYKQASVICVREIIATNYKREAALFIIDRLMSRDDKQCNKNVTTDHATVAIVPRHRYRVVCVLSIFLDLVPRGEGMNYLNILFRPFVCLFLFVSFRMCICGLVRTGITRWIYVFH